MLSRWKEYFQQHLNESSEKEPHTNRESLRENYVAIDLLRRDQIVEAIKYLKGGRQLKRGGPSLVNALNEMIQQVWIGETLPESWTDGVMCSVYKNGEKLDCKNYRRFCQLNVA
jgi:hypothetical protein